MSERPGREFEVVVRPGFLVTMIGLVAAFMWYHTLSTMRLGLPVDLVESLDWGAAVTVVVLLGTIIHELGHVAAGQAAGHRWTKAILNGAGLGVVIEPKPQGWDRVLRSAAGPFAQLLFSLALLAVAAIGTPATFLNLREAGVSIWWVGGVSSLFLALLNALPIPGFDGAKVFSGARQLFRGRRATVRGWVIKT